MGVAQTRQERCSLTAGRENAARELGREGSTDLARRSLARRTEKTT